MLFLTFFVVSFFFFKQKTAYEMRISDWSSDVCSSDLQPRDAAGAQRAQDRRHLLDAVQPHDCGAVALREPVLLQPGGDSVDHRSEEHTSELQSLMRISYAVFCLKKKKHSQSYIYQQIIPKLHRHYQHTI